MDIFANVNQAACKTFVGEFLLRPSSVSVFRVGLVIDTGFEVFIFVLMKIQSYFSDAVSIGIYRSYRNIGAVFCRHLQGTDRLRSGDEGIRNVGIYLSTQRHF
jgi:hypothetical protein